jgi:hypothetical protein
MGKVEPSRRATVAPLFQAVGPDAVEVAWYCLTCGTIYKTREEAERCFVQHSGDDRSKHCSEWSCKDCGRSVPHAYQQRCHACLEKHYLKQEQEHLAAAENVISAEDYPSDQGVVYNAEYYQCIEDLVECCRDRGEEVPSRVWATEPSTFQLDLDNILRSAWDNWVEDLDCDEDLKDMRHVAGYVALRDAVREFNAAQTFEIFRECSTAVDLTKISGRLRLKEV